MNISLDDPRWTAFALGELDEAGRSALEIEIQKSDECRDEVEELTRTAARVRAGLASEPAPGLLPAQQQAIESKLRRSRSKAKLSWLPRTENARFNWLLKTAIAVAAVLLISLVRVPLPAQYPVLWAFQNASTGTAYGLMQLAGVPATRDGLFLTVNGADGNPTLSFSPECCPISWSLILLVTSWWLGNLYLRSPGKRLLLIVSVIPLVIVRDGLHMFAIAELCLHTSARAAIDSPIFHYGGSIFFALFLIPLVFLLVRLRRLELKS